MGKKERKPFKEWGITKWVKKHGENILDVAALVPGISTGVNIVRKVLLKKGPMARVIDPIEATRLETNATPEGDVNKTKSTMVIMFGVVIINALVDRYFGWGFLPEGFIRDIFDTLKGEIIHVLKNLIMGLFS